MAIVKKLSRKNDIGKEMVKADLDLKTIIISKAQLAKFMEMEKLESRAKAMECMRDQLYSYIAKVAKIPLNFTREMVTIKFEI